MFVMIWLTRYIKIKKEKATYGNKKSEIKIYVDIPPGMTPVPPAMPAAVFATRLP